jgi:hypothetical protein
MNLITVESDKEYRMLTLVGQYWYVTDDNCFALPPPPSPRYVRAGRETMYWPDLTRRLPDDQAAMCFRQYKDYTWRDS